MQPGGLALPANRQPQARRFRLGAGMPASGRSAPWLSVDSCPSEPALLTAVLSIAVQPRVRPARLIALHPSQIQELNRVTSYRASQDGTSLGVGFFRTPNKLEPLHHTHSHSPTCTNGTGTLVHRIRRTRCDRCLVQARQCPRPAQQWRRQQRQQQQRRRRQLGQAGPGLG